MNFEIIKFQLLYMMRPHCRIRDKFINTISENLKQSGIDVNGELWIEIMARVIKSCSIGPEEREFLLSPIIDAIEYLEKEVA